MRARKGLNSAAIACFVVTAVLVGSAAVAEDKTYVMKLGFATINDNQHEFAKDFVAAVEKDSGNRIKGEIYPASQLGTIPRMIEGVQFASIQGYVGPPEFLVGIDERYEVLSAPGLVADPAHAQRIAADPEVQKMMLGFGATKGIHGAALFINQPSAVIAKNPIRSLADFKGKKLRVLAADMQQEMMRRLGATPVAMTLGDVLPAIQQGTIDGASSGITVFTTFKYWDAAKAVTETGQPYIFGMAFLSRKWFEALPPDLQQIVDRDAAEAAARVNPWSSDFYYKQRALWSEHGDIISLSAEEQASLMASLAAVSEEVASRRPALKEAYERFAAVAKRTK